MIVPVTVIGSIAVVLCLSRAEPGRANASGATSKQVRVAIIFFMMPPFLMSKSLRQFGSNKSHIVSLPQSSFTSPAHDLFFVPRSPFPSAHASALENVPASGRVIGRNEGSCHA